LLAQHIDRTAVNTPAIKPFIITVRPLIVLYIF
jgi:hypothetical protein